MKKYKIFFHYILIIMTALASALNYRLFVFPNSFAPAGIDGIATMIRYLADANIGYLSSAFNIPMLFIAWRFFGMKRGMVLKTMLYIMAFSLFSICLDYVDVCRFCYHTENGSSVVLAPVVAGVIRGILYPITLGAGGISGGMDIVAEMVKYKKPHYNTSKPKTLFSCIHCASTQSRITFTRSIICGMVCSTASCINARFRSLYACFK